MNFTALRPASRIFAEAVPSASVVTCSKTTYFSEAASSFGPMDDKSMRSAIAMASNFWKPYQLIVMPRKLNVRIHQLNSVYCSSVLRGPLPFACRGTPCRRMLTNPQLDRASPQVPHTDRGTVDEECRSRHVQAQDRQAGYTHPSQ